MNLRTTMWLSAIALGSNLAQAEGELMVMPATLKVFNNHEYVVNVKNIGDAPLYLAINLQKVTNPGIEPEIKLALNQLDRPGMLASPDKLTLGAGQSRAINLKSLAEPATEALYRLYILPVRAMQVDDAPESKITAPMSVSVGYGVLIRHMPPPAKQTSGLTHRCEAGGITLENTGSVRVVLSDVAVQGTSQKRTQLALFPGTPQHFAGKRLQFIRDEQPQTLECL